jgi:S-adenosylmethionine:tRNA ribosyltransferase-isomerase
MTPAQHPRDDPRTTRLLVVDAASDTLRDGPTSDLADLLGAGDLLVFNDAATMPASLQGHGPGGEALELRLASEHEGCTFAAVLFGAGDWRQRTEDRPPPPHVEVGDRLAFATLNATVVAIDPAMPRLLTVRFDRNGADLWAGLYASGRPVQYSYLTRALDLWDVQTPFAGRPWAVEPPSAGFAMSWELLLALRQRGVAFARLTHAAGLSSTGDAALDRRLPFAERYEVPEATLRAIAETRTRKGRVIAVGTTVVRALESARLRPAGFTDLHLQAGSQLANVDGILTGMHEVGTDHFELLEAFAPHALLLRANQQATALGFLGHEFGDAALILADTSRHSALNTR